MLSFTKVPRLTRSLGRLAEIARTLAKYGLADTLARLDNRFVRRWTRGTEVARLSIETREARIRLVLTELGTTFIKFGQVLSTRQDVIGPELGCELSLLQSHVPADPFTITQSTVERELGRPLPELFAAFDPEPLASGSIGQVHQAKTYDGRRVAVKVQHPGVDRQVADDLVILHELAELAEEYLPEFRPYRPIALVEEFERTIERELNFCRELRHLQLFRQAFAADPGVRFPEPYPQLSTTRVLTMEFLDGIPFNQPKRIEESGGNFDELAKRGARAFLDMIFRDCFFHADPHPGNLMYLPPTAPDQPGVIGVIDVGMVARIDEGMHEKIVRAMSAVVHHDPATLTELIVQVGDIQQRFDRTAMQAEVSEQLAFYYGMPLEQFQLGSALTDLTEAIRRYHVMLPSTLSMLLRVLIILEGTARLLAPSFNLMELLEPYQRRMSYKKLSPRRLWRRLAAVSGDWEDLIRDTPRQVGSILRMLQRQEMGVQLMHRHLEPSVNRLVFGLMVSALFVGSAMMWAYQAPPVLGSPSMLKGLSIFGVSGCCVSVLLGYRLFRAIQHSGRLEEDDRIGP